MSDGSETITFILRDDEEITVEKKLLSNSEFFGALFSYENYAEDKAEKIHMKHCNYEYIKKSVMESVLNLIINKVGVDEIELTNLEDVLEMNEVARKFMLPDDICNDLATLAKRILNSQEDWSNIFSGLEMNFQFNFGDLKGSFVMKILDAVSEADEEDEVIRELQKLNIDLVKYLLDTRAEPIFRLRALSSWFLKNHEICTEEEKNEIKETFDLEDDFNDEEILTDLRRSGLYRHVNVFNDKMNKDEAEIEELNDSLTEVDSRSNATFEEMESELEKKDKMIKDLIEANKTIYNNMQYYHKIGKSMLKDYVYKANEVESLRQEFDLFKIKVREDTYSVEPEPEPESEPESECLCEVDVDLSKFLFRPLSEEEFREIFGDDGLIPVNPVDFKSLTRQMKNRVICRIDHDDTISGPSCSISVTKDIYDEVCNE